MQNEFEKKVQQQLEHFEVAPAEAVWQKVEAQIKKEKKRRRILFYWMPAAMFLIAGGAYFFATFDNDKKALADKKQDKAIPKQSLEMITRAPKEKPTASTATYYKPKTPAANSNSNLITETKRSIHYNKEVIAATVTINRKDVGEKKLIEKKTADVDNKQSVNERKKYEDNSNKASKPIEKIKKEDTLKDTSDVRGNATAEKKALTIADSSLVIKPADKEVPVAIKATFKKISWGVTVYTGISNNINALIGLPSTMSAMDRLSTASPITTGQPNTYSYYPVTDHF